jgi:hypothetical protein
VFSHHSLETLINGYAAGDRVRHLAAEVEALLLRFPNVVCWFNGHTHAHAIRAVRAAAGHGFWQVTTASHVDWPQQGRIVELAVDADRGDLVVTVAVFDHAGVVDPRSAGLDEPRTLAGWSRELSANAWQGRALDASGVDLGEPVGRGSALDRNVVLVVPAPFPLHALATDSTAVGARW